MWKRKQQSPTPPDFPIAYPDGIAVSTEKQRYYIKQGKKIRFTSDRVFESWGLEAVPGSEASVSGIPTSVNVMGFRDGSLVMDFEDNTLYLISGLRRRKITNPDWMDYLNMNVRDAIVASAKELALHAEGDDLD